MISHSPSSNPPAANPELSTPTPTSFPARGRNPLRFVLRCLPSAATLAGMTCGLIAIRFAVLGDVQGAAWCVLYAVLLDQVDGTLARVLGATSPLGQQLDSFADFVSFGIAPAFLCLGPRVVDPAWGPLHVENALAACFVYACALRLARFNASSAPTDRFHGFPSTLAGALVATSVIVSVRHGHALEGAPLAFLLGALAVLMLTPYGPRKMNALLRAGLSGNRWLAGFVIANISAAYVLAALQRFPEYLLGMALCYAISAAFRPAAARPAH